MFAKNKDLIAQNSLALYRNVNQASPPSMLPPESQVTQPDGAGESFEGVDFNNALNIEASS